MTKAFVRKNVKLSMEFDTYLAHHPDLENKIPNHAYVIMTVEGDDKFNADSLSLVKKIKREKIVAAHKSQDSWSLRPVSELIA